MKKPRNGYNQDCDNWEQYHRQEIAKLKSLIEEVKVAVTLFKADTPAQIKWRDEWLEKAREVVG